MTKEVKGEVTKIVILELLGTYDINGGFYVDIVFNTEEQVYGYWIYHKDYGIKEYCVGLPKFHKEDGHQIEMIPNIQDAEAFLYQDVFREFKTDYSEEYMITE